MGKCSCTVCPSFVPGAGRVHDVVALIALTDEIENEMNDTAIGSGTGRSKKEAEQMAAKAATETLTQTK